ncbi:transcription factor TFIIE beta subunit, TFIIEB, Tfa2 [Coemansia sp. RSA 2706]|nr:transcription factor TFIIE beta subunit, TFIIEB, Tfa2 [Coemansia sp. RSA 2708]KAJ1834578.1 transcription factor TFIIE beta subunit, TFIIEB, Tfa2 [Coemansia sp. RSA 2711]KAJ2303497.1 transcription factor TFIIE beta subunit, TFIIEB, Tfa2 [Coemansia sp. RSA 2706]KAJ2313950.1 transcription factor TFIIE beta subunit, TFIIEB, Tfa2 [Coemansia sp. RSA 2705]KAJ2316685.1 transcription factor TFIIE beta subunit, TFIIEB, Tfa2 [Coemansia sp. RSA 2702]KAJ2317986.1 transcription factor TFIIE beta subunit,
MSDLLEKGKQFRQKIASQPVVRQRRVVNLAATSSRRDANEAPEVTKTHKNAATLTRVYEVVEFLKKSQRPCTVDEIRMHIHDFREDGSEFEHLVSNAKVQYNAQSHTFAYKPDYDIRSADELLDYLRQMPDQSGLEVKRLQDSYLADKLSKTIAELREQRRILAITDKDNRPRYIYYNHCPVEDHIDLDMKQSWMRMVVPGETDLADEMRRADLVPTRIEKGEEDEKKEVKKPKRAQRKIKVTNTHLVGIDLTKDYGADGS